jgi:hypothetical protein
VQELSEKPASNLDCICTPASHVVGETPCPLVPQQRPSSSPPRPEPLDSALTRCTAHASSQRLRLATPFNLSPAPARNPLTNQLGKLAAHDKIHIPPTTGTTIRIQFHVHCSSSLSIRDILHHHVLVHASRPADPRGEHVPDSPGSACNKVFAVEYISGPALTSSNYQNAPGWQKDKLSNCSPWTLCRTATIWDAYSCSIRYLDAATLRALCPEPQSPCVPISSATRSLCITSITCQPSLIRPKPAGLKSCPSYPLFLTRQPIRAHRCPAGSPTQCRSQSPTFVRRCHRALTSTRSIDLPLTTPCAQSTPALDCLQVAMNMCDDIFSASQVS